MKKTAALFLAGMLLFAAACGKPQAPAQPVPPEPVPESTPETTPEEAPEEPEPAWWEQWFSRGTDPGLPPPQGEVMAGGRSLAYLGTRDTDLTLGLNCQNGTLTQRRVVYTDEDGNLYALNEEGRLTFFLRGEEAPEGDGLAGDSWDESAAIEAEALGVDLSGGQVVSSGGTETGGRSVVFAAGEDPALADQIIVTLGRDGGLFSLIVQPRPGSLTREEAAFFDASFESYRQGLGDRLESSTVIYRRCLEGVAAVYSLVLVEDGGYWMELVSFLAPSPEKTVDAPPEM